MQQPCTTVWITLLTKTRLMDLDEVLNKSQYKSKRPEDHKYKQRGFSKLIRQVGITISDNSNNTVYCKTTKISVNEIKIYPTDCATAVEGCHTSTCGQRGCPSLGGCYNLLHRLNSCMNSAGCPSHVSASRCTLDEARLPKIVLKNKTSLYVI